MTFLVYLHRYHLQHRYARETTNSQPSSSIANATATHLTDIVRNIDGIEF
ncbi:hypothetical protein HYC85_025522 [Camellia sinensis]|uniref:Uncharacterized protein n=1 Tax=Camellia sinensis TaxID=4442 RepID=A0A7J7GF91_CAMSI|nr:hypothetical protein HYC85_025522 [Camellia sinensis]